SSLPAPPRSRSAPGAMRARSRRCAHGCSARLPPSERQRSGRGGRRAAGRPTLVCPRQIADTETPVSAALKLIEPGRGDYLLESVEGGRTRGRHSMIGLAPDLVVRAKGGEAAINPKWLTDRDAFVACEGDSLSALR